MLLLKLLTFLWILQTSALYNVQKENHLGFQSLFFEVCRSTDKVIILFMRKCFYFYITIYVGKHKNILYFYITFLESTEMYPNVVTVFRKCLLSFYYTSAIMLGIRDMLLPAFVFCWRLLFIYEIKHANSFL